MDAVGDDHVPEFDVLLETASDAYIHDDLRGEGHDRAHGTARGGVVGLRRRGGFDLPVDVAASELGREIDSAVSFGHLADDSAPCHLATGLGQLIGDSAEHNRAQPWAHVTLGLPRRGLGGGFVGEGIARVHSEIMNLLDDAMTVGAFGLSLGIELVKKRAAVDPDVAVQVRTADLRGVD